MTMLRLQAPNNSKSTFSNLKKKGLNNVFLFHIF